MRKQIKFVRYIGVLFLTILIFLVGIFFGGSVEELRVQSLYTQLQEQDLEYQSIVTEGNYIQYLASLKEGGENVSCEVLIGAYYTSISNLDDARLKLENYINSGKVKEEEFARLKEHYSNVQVNYWLLGEEISTLCEEDLNIILYFYGEDKKICPACEDQGVHLSYVKQKLNDNVLIFSFDSQKEGVIKLLNQRFGVNERELPVIVIKDSVYGFLNNQEIFDILCDEGLNNSICNG